MGKFQRIYWKKNFDWENYAQLYDKYSKPKDNYYEKSSYQLIQTIKLKDNAKIIDLGCGTGVMSKVLLKKYPKINILAIDLSEEMIFFYKKNFKKEIKNGQIKVLQGNAERISDLTNEQYDAVFISSALWDMEIKPLFKSLRSVLKNKGKILFNLPALVVGKDRGFIYFIEHFFRKTLQSDIIYRRISVESIKEISNDCKLNLSYKKDYSFDLTKKNVESFFDVLRYRYPFILFPKEMPYPEKFKRCSEIFNDSLRYIPKEGLKEEGTIFVIEK